MKNSIKVKCVEEFTLHNHDFTKVLADVTVGEYVAELYKDTEEYFAKDGKDRELFVGEINFDGDLILQDGFELIKS